MNKIEEKVKEPRVKAVKLFDIDLAKENEDVMKIISIFLNKP